MPEAETYHTPNQAPEKGTPNPRMTSALNLPVKQLPIFRGEQNDSLPLFVHTLKGWVHCNLPKLETAELLNLLETAAFPFMSPALNWFSARRSHYEAMTVANAIACMLGELQVEFCHLVPDPTSELVGMRLANGEQVSAFAMRFAEVHRRTSVKEEESMRLLIKAVDKNQQVHHQLTTTMLTQGTGCTVAMLCRVAEQVARMGLSSSSRSGGVRQAEPKSSAASSFTRQPRQVGRQSDQCPRHSYASHTAQECRKLQAGPQNHSFAASMHGAPDAQQQQQQLMWAEMQNLRSHVQQLQLQTLPQPVHPAGPFQSYAAAEMSRRPMHSQDTRNMQAGRGAPPRYPPHQPCGTYHTHGTPCPNPRQPGYRAGPQPAHTSPPV